MGQKIASVRLYNPTSEDTTPIIGLESQEKLLLSFDDLSAGNQPYRYTLRHLDRHWQDDGLFFTEFAKGQLSGLIDRFRFSFNTLQSYTHYELEFPNEKMSPKISGNFELVVYRDSPSRPLFVRRFIVSENLTNVQLTPERWTDPIKNQRIQAKVTLLAPHLQQSAKDIQLWVIQNADWYTSTPRLFRPSGQFDTSLVFQQPELCFPGNYEFFYFNSKTLTQAFDQIQSSYSQDGQNYMHLYPIPAYPTEYRTYPDLNGRYYFLRNDLGTERNPSLEADYVHIRFFLASPKTPEREFFVTGPFNDYAMDEKSKMSYDNEAGGYTAMIYLKQGIYNYQISTRKDQITHRGEVSGNFWQTENRYQGIVYYRPFGHNYDGVLGYGQWEISRPGVPHP